MNKKERLIGLDIVRTLAVILVLTVHFFLNTKFYSTNLVGKNMYIQAIIRNFCMVCVPLFMVLKGFLNKEKEYNKKFFKKILSIILIWLFYSVIEYIYKTPRSNISTLNLLNSIFSFEACEYSWYINMFIGLYLITPLINNGVEKMNKKDNIILITILIYITLISTVFNEIFKIGIIYPSWWRGIYPITYYLIGKFIKKYSIEIRKKTLIKFIVAISLFECMFIYIQANGRHYPWTTTISWDSIVNAANTICIFLMLYKLEIKSKIISNTFKIISIYSLDIYLASSLVDKIVYNKIFNLTNLTQQQIIFKAPVILIIVFTFSLLLGVIRKKIIDVR